MLKKIISLFFGVGGNLATKTVGTVGTITVISGIITWLFGPGRDMAICLNALELSGVVFGAQVILQWALRKPAPFEYGVSEGP